MTTTTRQKLFAFAKTYPPRRCSLPFFAHKFIRYMYRRGLATVLHRDAVVLLTLIVLTEDQVHYRRPVGFWGSELTAMTGMTKSRVDQMTKLCSETGWLAYCSGAKGVQGTYFVQVPGGDELAMKDSPLGQDSDESLVRGMEREPVTAEPVVIESRPSRLSPADIAASADWSQLMTQLRACDVKSPASCLARAAELIDRTQIQAVVSYHLSRRINVDDEDLYPYGGGSVVVRLTNPDFAALPPQEGWPHEIDATWLKEHKRREDARRRRDEADRLSAERDAREARRVAELTAAQQLELQFGGLVDELIVKSPEYLWTVLTRFNEQVGKWGRNATTNPSGFHSKVVRSQLLRCAAAGLLS